MKKLLMFLCIAALVIGMMGSASAVQIFLDEFNRGTTKNVGNGWMEIEDDLPDVAIENGVLMLRDNRSVPNPPTASRPDAAVTQAVDLSLWTDVTLDFDWAGAGNTENNDHLFVSYKNWDGHWTLLWQTPNGLDELGRDNFAIGKSRFFRRGR